MSMSVASLMFVVVHSFPSYLAGLGQKSSVLSMVLCQNGPETSLNWISKVDNGRKVLTVLEFILWFLAQFNTYEYLRIT